MANPFRNLFLPRRVPVEIVTQRRTFDDVILPPATRRALEQALSQIRKQTLIFESWGLAERHPQATGLAFNFAGPPGTGKTICAQAVAHALGRELLVVRYDELESMWAGETGRNVAAVFRAAEEQGAVLFFDEADAIAGRRFTSTRHGYEREANAVINILLRELENFPGVVIFATNLAANFDPAFERRIRTHIRFDMPGAEEREQIWRVQLHQHKTPLADDVDFRALAEAYPASGGDIKNAVLKAALAASSEPGPDFEKRIHQRHFIEGIGEVLAARSVMEQTLFEGNADPLGMVSGPLAALASGHDTLEENLSALAGRVVEVEDSLGGVGETVERSRGELRRELAEALGRTEVEVGAVREALAAGDSAARGRVRAAFAAAGAALVVALGALAAALLL